MCVANSWVTFNFFFTFELQLCPLQGTAEAGEGGYSHEEWMEIDGLLTGQCQEVTSVAEDWHGQIAQLQLLQDRSLNLNKEFAE